MQAQSKNSSIFTTTTDTLTSYDALPQGVASAPTAEQFFQQARQVASREDFGQANALFHQAAALSGGREIWSWKSLGFCPSVFPDAKSIDLYWRHLNESLDLAIAAQMPMDWQRLPTDGSCPSFNLSHLNKCCREPKEKHARLFEKAFPQSRPPIRKRSSGKLRIGFHTLHGHEGGFTRCSAGLINAMNKRRFEIFIFAPDLGIQQCRSTINPDGVTFVPLGGPFPQVVQKVRDTECDLIYYRKVGSDPWSYFFPFARCAPVQITSCGTHGTSGASCIDYFLSSACMEPEDAQQYYTEKLVRLPSMHLYLTPVEPLSTLASREALYLPARGAIYFCPHRMPKYHPSFDWILQHILDRDPTANLVLLTGRDPRGREIFMSRLKTTLGPKRIARMVFIPSLPYDKYKQLLSLSTVLLDSPVYAGGLTSYDAVSYGIPEITLSGPLLVQNFATGVYRKTGLDFMPCKNAEEYVDKAVRLGTNPAYRHEISLAMQSGGSAIFGNRNIVTDHENFFEAACKEAAQW